VTNFVVIEAMLYCDICLVMHIRFCM